jgi:hypothetical protein
MNPTLGLIERMKVVGADIERRKTNAPDRFFSHFYFGPDKNLHLVSVCWNDTSFELMIPNTGKAFSPGTRYAQRGHKANAEGRQTTASCSVTRQTQISSARITGVVKSSRL